MSWFIVVASAVYFCLKDLNLLHDTVLWFIKCPFCIVMASSQTLLNVLWQFANIIGVSKSSYDSGDLPKEDDPLI